MGARRIRSRDSLQRNRRERRLRLTIIAATGLPLLLAWFLVALDIKPDLSDMDVRAPHGEDAGLHGGRQSGRGGRQARVRIRPDVRSRPVVPPRSSRAGSRGAGIIAAARPVRVPEADPGDGMAAADGGSAPIGRMRLADDGCPHRPGAFSNGFGPDQRGGIYQLRSCRTVLACRLLTMNSWLLSSVTSQRWLVSALILRT